MARHVVLLRGINLGPNNRVRMAALREALDAAGFTSVRTYVQSGNVVLDSRAGAETVHRRVRDLMRDVIHVDVDVVVRPADEFRAAVEADPFADVRTDGSRHFVVFCDPAPDPEALPQATGDERLEAHGREVHLWCPGGARDSALMTALGRRAGGPVATVRNWNTVTRLREMLDE